MVNFSKDLENEKLIKWSQYYIDYTKLKKIINPEDEIKSIFFLFEKELEFELNKINNFYIKNINDIKNELIELKDNIDNLTLYNNHIDELRQYILLNIVGIIKIVKKRNKKANKLNFDNTLDIKSILNRQKFYKSIEFHDLLNLYNKVKIDLDIEHLDKIFTNSESFLTIIFNKNPDFDFNLLTNNPLSKKWTIDDINAYLYKKLNIDEFSITLDNDFQERQDNILSNFPVKKEDFIRYIYILSIFVYLYGFLIGLDMMGSSFKALSGKNIGSLFDYVDNPIAGLIVGILVTVLLQSSSTTTSIIVTMVGANIISTNKAIPLIMGANIGTSITNTLIAHGNIRDINEFKKAFSGAVIHDIFNFCTVLIMLPIEVISDAFNYPILLNLSKFITNNVLNIESVEFKSPLKIIVSPVVKKFISIDKNVIKGLAQGCINCNVTEPTSCWDIKHKKCYTHTEWLNKYDKDIIKKGYMADLGDLTGGIICLLLSLFLLCLFIYLIIKTLHTLVIGENRGEGLVFECMNSAIAKNGCCTMFFGMILTILVQSSSITTSVFTPLVGLSVISLEQMLPLTLGANIGTTCTAFIASIVSGSRDAIQIAICHLCFNLLGICILYPFSYTRNFILDSAKRLGDFVEIKGFTIFYVLYTFILLPFILLGISQMFQNIFGTIIGIILILIVLFLSIMLFYRFNNIFNMVC